MTMSHELSGQIELDVYDDCHLLIAPTSSKPLISVLVAIHNMEANGLLERCLSSFAVQSFREVEYILVDDASTDGSRALAVEWASQRDDACVLALDTNKRQGTARNRGISAARGDYIAIVDADDMVPANYFEQIAKAIDCTGADAIVPEFIQRIDMDDNEAGDPIANVPNETVLGAIDEYKRKIMILEHWMFSVNKRSMFTDAGNLYPEGMLYEDTPAAIRWFFYYQSVACAYGAVYLYRTNPQSTTNTTGVNEKAFSDRMRSCDMILDNALELGVLDDYRNELEEYYVRVCLCNTLGMLAQASGPVMMARDLGRHVRARVPRYPKNPYLLSGPLNWMKSYIRWRFTVIFYVILRVKYSVARI